MDSRDWRKASFSNGQGNCVEVGHVAGNIGVRDTKFPGTSPVLAFTPDAWAAFVKNIGDVKLPAKGRGRPAHRGAAGLCASPGRPRA